MGSFLLISYLLVVRLTYMFVTGRWFDEEVQRLKLSYEILNWMCLGVVIILLLFQIPVTLFTYRTWKEFRSVLYHRVGADAMLTGMRFACDDHRWLVTA